LITGNGLEAVQEGAVDVVVRKPFTRAELENTVHTLLHREDRQWVRTHLQGRSAHRSI
jgi:DNA-binding response OmpR family regulator